MSVPVVAWLVLWPFVGAMLLIAAIMDGVRLFLRATSRRRRHSAFRRDLTARWRGEQ
jgi:hypothetical protein